MVDFSNSKWPWVTSMVYIQGSLQGVTTLSTLKGWRTETFPGIDSQIHPFLRGSSGCPPCRSFSASGRHRRAA